MTAQKKCISLPEDLFAWAEARAQTKGMSFSGYIQSILDAARRAQISSEGGQSDLRPAPRVRARAEAAPPSEDHGLRTSTPENPSSPQSEVEGSARERVEPKLKRASEIRRAPKRDEDCLPAIAPRRPTR